VLLSNVWMVKSGSTENSARGNMPKRTSLAMHCTTHHLYSRVKRVYASRVFALEAHVDRLIHSAQLLGFELPFDADMLCQACNNVIKTNEIMDGYMRPVAWVRWACRPAAPPCKPPSLLGLGPAISNARKAAVCGSPWQHGDVPTRVPRRCTPKRPGCTCSAPCPKKPPRMPDSTMPSCSTSVAALVRRLVPICFSSKGDTTHPDTRLLPRWNYAPRSHWLRSKARLGYSGTRHLANRTRRLRRVFSHRIGGRSHTRCID
jgi:hypothetical protein